MEGCAEGQCQGVRKALLAVPRVELHGSVPYRPSEDLRVPRSGGVYLIHDLRGCLYIGRSDCLNDRFHQHYDFSHNLQLREALRVSVGPLGFSWLLSEGQVQKNLEQRLIRNLHPLCNDIRYTNTKEN